MSDTKQVIVIRKDLNMRKGKIAAQVAHASMLFLTQGAVIRDNPLVPDPKDTELTGSFEHTLTHVEVEWLLSPLKTKIVAYVNSEHELIRLMDRGQAAGLVVHEMYDQGLTEFRGQVTLTCVAFGPARPELIDPVTGHLPLL